MVDKRVVLLAQAGTSTNMLFNSIQKSYSIEKVIIEKSEGRKKFLKRRAKRMGWWSVLGQVMFMFYQKLILMPVTWRRRAEVANLYQLDRTPIPDELIIKVESCNSDLCRDLLRSIDPGLVLINGTRIISEKTIYATSCVMVNIHAGITPKYRGVHGGYWALRMKEPQLCGTSLHIIDQGVDTGSVLDQSIIHPTNRDSFTTYPLLQLGEGIRLLLTHIPNLLDGKIVTKTAMTNESKIWYHPTLWDYLTHPIA